MPQADPPPPSVIASHLGLTYGLGAMLPMGVLVLVPLVFAGGPAVAVGALVATVVVVALLYVIVAVTPSATSLGVSGPRRLLWALLVFGFGMPLWGLGWLGIAHSDGTLPWLSAYALSGVPFTVIAGLLVRRWQVAVSFGLGLMVLVASGTALTRRADDAQRLRNAPVNRDIIVVTTIAGYMPTSGSYGGAVGSEFLPADPAAIPPLKSISIVAYSQTYKEAGSCGPVALDAKLSIADCEREADGLIYRHGAVEHGYQVRRGEDIVEIAGTLAVDRVLLHNAALKLHVPTAAETKAMNLTVLQSTVYVAEIPGYRGQPTGMPPGVQYEPADPAQLRTAVVIRLFRQFDDDGALCYQATCEPDGQDLTYVRRPDGHGYIFRHGAVAVVAMGGVSVPRDVLKQAALTARPPTDAEMLHSLPPQRSSGGLRELLRRLRFS